MATIQDAKNLNKLLLEELVRSFMTHEINMKKHQEVEKINNMEFKGSTNDNEEEKKLRWKYLIPNKFMNYIWNLRRFRGEGLIQKKCPWMQKKKSNSGNIEWEWRRLHRRRIIKWGCQHMIQCFRRKWSWGKFFFKSWWFAKCF